MSSKAHNCGHIVNSNTRNKISNSLQGHNVSSETKEKISKALTGRKLSKEQKQINKKNLDVAREIAYANKRIKCICLNNGRIYDSIRDAEKDTGVCNANISAICKGKLKQCKGFIFAYYND